MPVIRSAAAFAPACLVLVLATTVLADPSAPPAPPAPSLSPPPAPAAPAPSLSPNPAPAPAAPSLSPNPAPAPSPVPSAAATLTPQAPTPGDEAHDDEDERLSDRVAMGGGVIVRRGERVRDAVAMGGDLVVEGAVEGSAVAMGGDVIVRSTGSVRGDATAMGGDLVVEPGARVDGARVELAGADGRSVGPAARVLGGHRFERETEPSVWLDAAGSAARWAVLLLLGLVLLGLAPERLDVLTRAMLRTPVASLAFGVVVAAGVTLVALALALTLIGIPAALLLGVLALGAAYVGLAAAARVIGGVLPIAWLRDRPVLQLAVGVGALFVASLVPWVGDAIVLCAALFGLGALWQTRFGRAAPTDDVPGSGPYRTVPA